MTSRINRLTKEKLVIMHLGRYHHIRDNQFCMPAGLTQDGIGNALSISRAHVSMTAKSLEKKGMIYNLLAHTEGSKIKRRVYRLTAKGIMELNKINRMISRLNTERLGQPQINGASK